MSDERKQTLDDVARDVNATFDRAIDAGHSDWMLEAEKYDAFFLGNQWDEKTKAKLDAQGRPALTLNLIRPAISAISGEQRATRAEFIFKPKGQGADATIATLLSKCALHVQDDNDFEWTESQVFDDGLILNRGWFDVRMDFNGNLNGEIKIKADDPFCIIPDPDGKEYDPETWNVIHEQYWLSMDEIEARYGRKKAEKVKNYVDNFVSTGTLDDVRFSVNRFGDARLTELRNEGEATCRYIKSVRIVERQQKRMHMSRVFVDLATGDVNDIPEGMPEERVQEIVKSVDNLAITTMLRPRIRWSVVVRNGVTLHDDWSPYPFFTKVPFFPWFRRGHPVGVVKELISAQEQLNKTESQELHVINTTANSGWIVEDGSLVGMTSDELEQRGAETGLVIRYARNAQPPQKIQPNQVPTGLDRKSSKTVGYMRELSVNRSFLGQDNAEVAGIVVEQNKSSALTQLRPAFDNLAYSRKLLAKKVLWFIQNYYTDPRILRITDYSQPGRPEEQVELNQVDPITGMIRNDVTLGEYSVVISNAPARDTLEETEFTQLLQLTQVGVPIPPDELVLRTNISNRVDLAARVARIAGTGEPTEEEIAAANAAQELEFAQMQAEVQRLQAQGAELESRAQLNAAKAQEMMAKIASGEDVSLELEKLRLEEQRIALEREKIHMNIQAKLQETVIVQQAKLAIADKQVGAKTEQMRHDSALQRTKLVADAMTRGMQQNGKRERTGSSG